MGARIDAGIAQCILKWHIPGTGILFIKGILKDAHAHEARCFDLGFECIIQLTKILHQHFLFTIGLFQSVKQILTRSLTPLAFSGIGINGIVAEKALKVINP